MVREVCETYLADEYGLMLPSSQSDCKKANAYIRELLSNAEGARRAHIESCSEKVIDPICRQIHKKSSVKKSPAKKSPAKKSSSKKSSSKKSSSSKKRCIIQRKCCKTVVGPYMRRTKSGKRVKVHRHCRKTSKKRSSGGPFRGLFTIFNPLFTTA